MNYSIEPHDEGYALYRGRDMFHHGYNLCNINDFDVNGKNTRATIISALYVLEELYKIENPSDEIVEIIKKSSEVFDEYLKKESI